VEGNTPNKPGRRIRVPGGARTVALAILVLATSASFALGFFVGRSQAPVKTVVKEVRVPVSRPAAAPVPEIEVAKVAPKPPVEIKAAPKPPPPRRISKKKKPVKEQAQVDPAKKSSGPSEQARYSVQVGAFETLIEAEKLRKDLEAKGYKSFVMRYAEPGQKAVFKVRLGEFIDSNAARLLSVKLKSIEGIAAFVVKSD